MQQTKTKIEKENYTDGMLFEVRLTSRYLTLMGNIAFEKLKLDLSFDDYIILDILSYNEGVCCIDLAKMLLRDRSNIGKTVSNLEKNGYVKFKADLRNKRAVKKIFMTKKGIKICNEIYPKLKPYIDIFNENFTQKDKEAIIKYMQKCRQLLENIAKNRI